MAASTDMSFWIKFFKEAGIPAGDAANYAVTFTDNRITRAMLMDLTKEYLNDMGISILGDVIAILKYAKTVHNQDIRDRVLRDTATPEVIAPKRSTPASRTIAHHIGSTDRSSSPLLTPSPKLSRELSARLGSPAAPLAVEPVPALTFKVTTNKKQKEEVPVPKKNRRVFPEDEGHYTVNLPQGTSSKTRKILERQRQQAELQRIRADEEKKRVGSKNMSVFSRLGQEKSTVPSAPSPTQPSVTITGLGNIQIPGSSAAQQSIFARLGGKTTVKRAATSTVTFDDDEDDDLGGGEPLEYAGVLKESPSKKSKLEVARKLTKTAHKTLAKAKPVQPQTAGILATGSGQVESGIKARLGPKPVEVSSTTHTQPSASADSQKKGSQSRLGKQNLDSLTITVDTSSKSKASAASSSTSAGGVFSRLGKPKP